MWGSFGAEETIWTTGWPNTALCGWIPHTKCSRARPTTHSWCLLPCWGTLRSFCVTTALLPAALCSGSGNWWSLRTHLYPVPEHHYRHNLAGGASFPRGNPRARAFTSLQPVRPPPTPSFLAWRHKLWGAVPFTQSIICSNCSREKRPLFRMPGSETPSCEVLPWGHVLWPAPALGQEEGQTFILHGICALYNTCLHQRRAAFQARASWDSWSLPALGASLKIQQLLI